MENILMLLYVFCLGFITQNVEAYSSCTTNCECTPFNINEITDGLKVDCSGRDLHNIPKLKHLDIVILDISFNKIADIPDYQHGIWGKDLKYLNLNRNGIEQIKNNTFEYFPKLSHIYLDYNSINTIVPNAFEKCNFLWKLTLNGNPIILPEKDGFLNIPSLGWLEMKNCNITNLNENIFRNLKRLVVIKLSNNHIAHIKPDLFSEMYHLRYIHLENNAISEIDPQTFKNNVQLEWLYIGHNSIYSISNEHFLNASALILLDLSFCKLTEATITSFSNLYNLTHLNLANNSLTTFEINNFPRSLEFLDLSDNNLMNLILPNKSKPKRSMLKYVDLSGNPIGLACDEICYIWKSCSDRSGNMCGLKTLYAEFIRSNCSSCHLEDSRNLEILLSDNYVILNESKNAENTSDIENEQSDIISVDTDLDLRVENETNNYNQSNDISKRNKLPEDTKGILNTILYSIIGFAAVLCILLLAVLVVKISLGFMISRRISRSSSVSTLRQIRLQLMNTNEKEERHEGRPVSIHQRFDYVSVPKTNLPEIVPRHNIRRPYKRK